MTYQTDLERLHAMTQADIDGMMSRSVMNDAQKLTHQGSVFSAVANGTSLLATVQGDGIEDNDVEITVEDGDLYAECTCLGGERRLCATGNRQDWDGWCKHIGAVLLTWIHDREVFEIVRVEGLDQLKETSGPDKRQVTMEVPSQQDIWIKEYRRLLINLKMRQLRQIAQKRGIALAVNATGVYRTTAAVEFTAQKSKDMVADELACALADRTAVQALVLQLDTLSLELLAYLNLSVPPDYGIPLANIKPLRSGSAATARGGSPPRQSSYSQDVIRQNVNAMAEQGLLIPFIQRRVTYYALPRLVRLCIPPLSDVVEPYPDQSSARIDPIRTLDVRTQDFDTLNQKLYRVWDYVAENHPKRPDPLPQDPIEVEWSHLEGWVHLPDEIAEIKSKGPFFYTQRQAMTVPGSPYQLREPEQKALCALVQGGNEEVEFLYALLAEIGAIEGKAGQTIRVNHAQIQWLLNMPPGRRLITLLQTWQTTTLYNEMDSVLRTSDDICVRRNVTYTTFKLADLNGEWREGRLAVFRFLALLPENQWVSVKSLQKTIYEVIPNLAHFLSHTGVWWLESIRRKKQFGATLDDWLASYGRLVLAILAGPLHWLGAIDLGYLDNGLEAVRLTPAGSFMLGRREELFEQQVDISPHEAIKLQDDLTATVVPGSAPIELYQLLGDICQLESATPKAFSYRLSAGSVQSQFDQGQSAQNLIAALEKTCPVEIPISWRDRLVEWQENYGKFHLYQGMCLIELADEYLARELMVSTSLHKNIIYQFSPRLIAVRPDTVDDLVQEMEKKGYMPHVE